MADAVPPSPRRTVWEQTLVATEQPADLETPLEPLPEPAPEVAPEPPAEAPADDLDLLEPEALTPADEAPMPPPLAPMEDVEERPATVSGVPDEFAKFVRAEGASLILKEPYLDRATKEKLERKVGKGGKMVERRWIPRRREPVRDVQRAIDELHWESRYKAKGVAWLEKHRKTKKARGKQLERIPANILGKRVVYETEGGFVVEVAYQERGNLLHKYFTVPAQGTRTKALESIQSGRYAEATAVGADVLGPLKANKKTTGTLQPGKIVTWPLHNDTDVIDILGIGAAHRRTLAEMGIHTTDQFRVRSPTVIARHLGVGIPLARKWQRQAELMVVPGLAERTAQLLVDCGIKGIDDLKAQTPAKLEEKIHAHQAHKKGRKQKVGRAKCAAWIRAANKLKKSSQTFPV